VTEKEGSVSVRRIACQTDLNSIEGRSATVNGWGDNPGVGDDRITIENAIRLGGARHILRLPPLKAPWGTKIPLNTLSKCLREEEGQEKSYAKNERKRKIA
jgi:hypothetical protein